MKLSCLVPRGMSALAVTLWAVTLWVLTLTGSSFAQFTPYGNSYQPYQWGTDAQRWSGPQYQPASYASGQPFMAGPQRPQQYAAQPRATANYGSQPYLAQPQYVAYAQQTPTLPPPAVPTEPVPPGPMQQGANGYMPQQQGAPYSQGDMNSAQGGYGGYSAGNCATGNCPVPYYGSGGSGYSCDGYGSNTPPAYGCCDVGYNCGPRHHWFGGVYGLLMDRVICNDAPLVYQTTTDGTGYYPTYDDVEMTYADLDSDVQGGAEVRFGATFAACGGPGGYGGCCDPCGGTGCGTLGWEAGYWALAEDTTYAAVYDLDTYADDGNVTYGMKSFNRLSHNPGGGWRPVNHYFAYGIPTQDYWTAWGNLAPQIRSIVARTSFSMQSVELNLVCLPTIGGGCSTCDPCSGGSSCGGCDSCGGGGCGGGGHFGGGCGAYCYSGPRCQVSTSLGARYVRFDDDFMLRSNYDIYDYTGAPAYVSSGSLAYYAETENHLVGFQIGSNGCYHLGCCGRVALHFGTNAGIYGNTIEMRQYFDGQVRDDGYLQPYDINDEDENIAFLGELRLGASYQCTCNCRLYGGYRALGVTGVALATDQDIATTEVPFTNCDGAIFLHGLQTGVEFMY